MKPATSLERWRETAGTRRCTSSNPTSASRQTPPTVRMPLNMVCSTSEISPLGYGQQHSSPYSGRRANARGRQRSAFSLRLLVLVNGRIAFRRARLSSALGEEPVADEDE